MKGSYSNYPTEGFTSYGGAESLQEGGIHLAGEHTCRYCNRGTMNGAVQSGNRAAQEVIAQIILEV